MSRIIPDMQHPRDIAKWIVGKLQQRNPDRDLLEILTASGSEYPRLLEKFYNSNRKIKPEILGKAFDAARQELGTSLSPNPIPVSVIGGMRPAYTVREGYHTLPGYSRHTNPLVAALYDGNRRRTAGELRAYLDRQLRILSPTNYGSRSLREALGDRRMIREFNVAVRDIFPGSEWNDYRMALGSIDYLRASNAGRVTPGSGPQNVSNPGQRIEELLDDKGRMKLKPVQPFRPFEEQGRAARRAFNLQGGIFNLAQRYRTDSEFRDQVNAVVQGKVPRPPRAGREFGFNLGSPTFKFAPLGDRELAKAIYYTAHDLSARGVSTQVTRDPQERKGRGKADYLDAKVPFGLYKGYSLQDLSGSYLSKLEEKYDWVREKAKSSRTFALFLAAWDHAMNQTWYKDLTRPFGDIHTNLSPADALQFDPYHPDNIHPLTPSFKGGPYWGGAGEYGVVHSGEEYQQIKFNRREYATDPIENPLGLTVYDYSPEGKATFSPYPENYKMTPYRYRGMGEYRHLYPSRANERRQIKQWDPLKRISDQRYQYYKQLGGMPDLTPGRERLVGGIRGWKNPSGIGKLFRMEVDRMKAQGATPQDIKEFKREWNRTYGRPIYGGARSVLEAELNRMRAANYTWHEIQHYKREFVREYARVTDPLVAQMARSERGGEIESRGTHAQPEGPDIEPQDPFIGPMPDEDYSETPATREDFPGEYTEGSAIEMYGTRGERVPGGQSADFGIGKPKGMSRRGKGWSSPFTSDKETLRASLRAIWETQNKEALEELVPSLELMYNVGEENEDPGFPQIRQVVNARMGFFNSGMQP